MENWKIWDRNALVEKRTYQRVKGELPIMESTKQLMNIVKGIYEPNMKILDVGCASGHYYNGLRQIDDQLEYTGFDSTKAYIEFAKKHFKSNKNVDFFVEDIFNLPNKYESYFDIVFSCNVLLHLPSIKMPLENLLFVSKKYVIIRSLFSENTHFSKFLYNDTFDENENPDDFVYQNTYSFNYIKESISKLGDYKYWFLDDEFNPDNINNEYNEYNIEQSAVTKVTNGLQIAGSKIFEWKWLIIEK